MDVCARPELFAPIRRIVCNIDKVIDLHCDRLHLQKTACNKSVSLDRSQVFISKEIARLLHASKKGAQILRERFEPKFAQQSFCAQKQDANP